MPDVLRSNVPSGGAQITVCRVGLLPNIQCRPTI